MPCAFDPYIVPTMSIRKYNTISPVIAAGAWVDEAAVVIGDVAIAEDVSIWPMVVARGDVNWIRIGARTNVQDGSVLHVSHDSSFAPGGYPLSIGADVTIGHKAVVHGCTIEDSCLIGMSATVMDGAVVRSGAMVGAGSLVPPGQDVEGGYLWVGTPARRVRPLREQERDFLAYSAKHYVDLKNEYLSAC